MNIHDFISNGANVSITISATDLQEVINYTITKTRMELEKVITDDKAEVYLSPAETAKLLKVSLTTLWHWNKRNYLSPVEVGGKRVYLQSEIKALLSKKNNNNNLNN
jgi:predicted DNA-binding transcriptional regulator AlpA